MGVIILVIVVFLVAQFFISRNQKQNMIARQGGMRTKYRDLIINLLSLNSTSRIVEEGKDYITIRATGATGYVDFELLQNANYLSVKWISVNTVFGKHSMKWEFPEYSNQDKMVERIEYDTSQYTRNVFNSYR